MGAKDVWIYTDNDGKQWIYDNTVFISEGLKAKIEADHPEIKGGWFNASEGVRYNDWRTDLKNAGVLSKSYVSEKDHNYLTSKNFRQTGLELNRLTNVNGDAITYATKDSAKAYDRALSSSHLKYYTDSEWKADESRAYTSDELAYMQAHGGTYDGYTIGWQNPTTEPTPGETPPETPPDNTNEVIPDSTDTVDNWDWFVQEANKLEQESYFAAMQAWIGMQQADRLQNITWANRNMALENALLAKRSAFNAAQQAYVQGLAELGQATTALSSTGLKSGNVTSMLERNAMTNKLNKGEMIQSGLMEATNWGIQASSYANKYTDLADQRGLLQLAISNLGYNLDEGTGSLTKKDEYATFLSDIAKHERDAKIADDWLAWLGAGSSVVNVVTGILSLLPK